MKIYVIEYKKDDSLRSKLISFFTGSKYTHTAMYMQVTKDVGYHLELSPSRDGNIFKQILTDYHTKKYKNLKTFYSKSPDPIDVFEVPFTFKNANASKVLKWWKKHEGKTYGYGRLILGAVAFPLFKFMECYVKLFKKPFPQGLIFDKGKNVCSTAVDECLKTTLNYDIFPEYPERVAYPGLFAKKLKPKVDL